MRMGRDGAAQRSGSARELSAMSRRNAREQPAARHCWATEAAAGCILSPRRRHARPAARCVCALQVAGRRQASRGGSTAATGSMPHRDPCPRQRRLGTLTTGAPLNAAPPAQAPRSPQQHGPRRRACLPRWARPGPVVAGAARPSIGPSSARGPGRRGAMLAATALLALAHGATGHRRDAPLRRLWPSLLPCAALPLAAALLARPAQCAAAAPLRLASPRPRPAAPPLSRGACQATAHPCRWACCCAARTRCPGHTWS
jgi:hypothetical protein